MAAEVPGRSWEVRAAAYPARVTRAVFVNEAVLVLGPGEDPRRPGAMVTVELCGHWEHDGPCRFPHHTAAEPEADDSSRLVVRTVFVAEPRERADVVERIQHALRADTGWRVLRTVTPLPSDAEQALGERWFDTPLPAP